MAAGSLASKLVKLQDNITECAARRKLWTEKFSEFERLAKSVVEGVNKDAGLGELLTVHTFQTDWGNMPLLIIRFAEASTGLTRTGSDESDTLTARGAAISFIPDVTGRVVTFISSFSLKDKMNPTLKREEFDGRSVRSHLPGDLMSSVAIQNELNAFFDAVLPTHWSNAMQLPG
ncbi:hypothetical protein [Myxococcus landrumensis]|uniref:Lipoprotein n=1 Tax=Myxococcus landrumensis TaxID=2813577 RepID=A0ABX7NE48_9BACT|nr:hypothetical protein [Myxococcus landrumus]QSQ16938.1 hypothetical protein JY572_13180 [Myxococcus landrumus]